ncbi:hypothetical protein P4O66_001579 [Electrophorus voltai]|uniref:Integrase catalytic domain-containing protein n=1 Tax=Electrophorus voltai TaxID=2609070 RepID=A0AAD8YNL3_9TELE|nr:hypothetical protein P4O66_001579 [Electrophorus voltai]
MQQPDPRKPFVVEVEASDVGVGVVLSQQKEKGDKLYPIAYFSRKLSTAERHYGVGDHELSMKLSFEEWRHWLEGAQHPFKVITDHKIQTMKRLNSRQAWWGPQFMSRVWKGLLGKLNITVSLTSSYHPQANGQVKRMNQELGKFLRLYSQQNPETWSTYLAWTEYVQNSLCHAGTGLTLFECVLGYQPPLCMWIKLG